MRRLDLHVPVLGASEPTGPLDAQQLLLSASLAFVQDAASRSVSSLFQPYIILHGMQSLWGFISVSDESPPGPLLRSTTYPVCC